MVDIHEENPSAAEGGKMELSKTEGVEIGTNGVVVDHGLHRSLKQRHLQMIALGGVVG